MSQHLLNIYYACIYVVSHSNCRWPAANHWQHRKKYQGMPVVDVTSAVQVVVASRFVHVASHSTVLLVRGQTLKVATYRCPRNRD